VRAVAPGRVNLIGEHTDYAGGLALPLAIDRVTTVTGIRRDGPGTIRLRSDVDDRPAVIRGGEDPATVEPPWARYVAAVAAQLQGAPAFEGTVTTSIPVGAGLSSSAALELAVALALGFDGPSKALAELGQRAEHAATGVPSGLMDQLTVAFGRAGHALLLDFRAATVEPVALPGQAEIVVAHSGQARTLVGSAYAERRAAVEAAAARIGPLSGATMADVAALGDPLLRRRARHVVSENQRVREAAGALAAGDLATAGAAMDASHRSLRDDFDVSTPALDALVERMRSRPGVFGARLTGAGFGGCAVALSEPGALDEGWVVRAGDGATVSTDAA
jgi:galactokinase